MKEKNKVLSGECFGVLTYLASFRAQDGLFGQYTARSLLVLSEEMREENGRPNEEGGVMRNEVGKGRSR